jgi:anti-anti-sigma regulatory factor
MTTDPHPDSVSLTWRIEEDAGSTIVTFFGDIDENADLSALRASLQGKVVFHLENIHRINSCGVREWVNFIRDLPRVSELTFIRCSPVTVTQLNMIYNFRGPARIESIYAPYICESCDSEKEELIDLNTQFPDGKIGDLPEFKCSQCGEPMEFDDIPDRYLSFLVDV